MSNTRPPLGVLCPPHPDSPLSCSIFSQPTLTPPSHPRPNVFSAVNLSQADALLLLRPENIFLPFHSLPQMVDLHFYVSLPQTVGDDSPFHFSVLGSQCGIWHTGHKPAPGNAVCELDMPCPGLRPHLCRPHFLSCGVGTAAVLGQG